MERAHDQIDRDIKRLETLYLKGLSEGVGAWVAEELEELDRTKAQSVLTHDTPAGFVRTREGESGGASGTTSR